LGMLALPIAAKVAVMTMTTTLPAVKVRPLAWAMKRTDAASYKAVVSVLSKLDTQDKRLTLNQLIQAWRTSKVSSRPHEKFPS
jgi:hypothetical protein